MKLKLIPSLVFLLASIINCSMVGIVKAADEFIPQTDRIIYSPQQISPRTQDALIQYEPPPLGDRFPIGLGRDKTWKVGGGFSYKAAYDSNVDRDPKGKEINDIIFSYIPSIYIRREGTIFKFESGLSVSYDQYFKTKNNSGFHPYGYNYFSYKGGKFSGFIHHSYSITNDLVTNEQRNRQNRFYNSIGAELSYQINPKFRVAATYDTYLNIDLKKRNNDDGNSSNDDNLMEHNIGGRLYYQIHQNLDIFAGSSCDLYFDKSNQDSDNGDNNDNSGIGYSIYAGTTGRMIRKTSWTILMGFRSRMYSQGGHKSMNGFYGEGMMTYKLTPKVNISAYAKRDISDSTYSNQGSYWTDSFGVGLNYRITPLMSANAGANFSYDSYSDSSNNNSTSPNGDSTSSNDNTAYINTHISLSYNPIRHVGIGVGYNFEIGNSRDSNGGYIDHYIWTSIGYHI